MTVEETKPKKGARLANKRRIATILILLLCSFIFVAWQEAPRLTIHNISNQPLLYIVKVNGNESSVGSIPSNTEFTINLPFIKGRNAAIYFQAKTSDKVISSLARTGYLGGIHFYIQPDLNISMEPTPLGFMTEQQEKDEVIIK
ncbi:hypothetical protein [Entomomonas asaccharolytica]|uniref:Uncharacterized protein n=1 Tax=Entomomonas asaccharolytica TaxID=2785331 RepID=A0A974NED7_9GAMM|nr:hypothetical protein [Entomomonas asaccharolytica]QQP85138.1 hypothetical protein JHT90_12215 [Entomomonas asaccharolytica]